MLTTDSKRALISVLKEMIVENDRINGDFLDLGMSDTRDVNQAIASIASKQSALCEVVIELLKD